MAAFLKFAPSALPAADQCFAGGKAGRAYFGAGMRGADDRPRGKLTTAVWLSPFEKRLTKTACTHRRGG